MRVISEAELQSLWDHLLDEIEKGATFVIERDGRAIAPLEPHEEVDRRDVASQDTSC